MPQKKSPDNTGLSARVLEKKQVYQDDRKLLTVNEYVIEFDKHDGGTRQVKRYMLERDESVAILAYDPKSDKILMINEFRAGLFLGGDSPFNNALPGGIIDAGETALDAAKREMFEETGISLKGMKVIHPGAYVSSGGSTEKLAIVFGLADLSGINGEEVHGVEGSTENIKSVVVKAKDFIRQASNGQLKNMGTCMAAFWLAQHKDALKKKMAPPAPAKKAVKKAETKPPSK